MKSSVATSSIAKLIGISKHNQVSFDGELLIITPKKKPIIQIKLNDIDRFNTESGIIWNEFQIILKDGSVHSIDGIPKSQTKQFTETFEHDFSKHYYSHQFEKALTIKELLPSYDRYFQTQHFNDLRRKVSVVMPGFRFLSRKPESLTQHNLFNTIVSLQNNDIFVQKEHNDYFINSELETYKEYFDTIEKNPLTEKQREAVVVNEQANLIIAGAGSGKTSVMVARVGYIIKKYGFKPEDILLLAYNKTAAEELQERIKTRLNISGTKVSTFHALGLEIIGKADGVKASVANWASNETEKALFIQDIIANLTKLDIKFEEKIMKFFSHPFSAYKSEFDFKSEIEYRQYIRDNRIITLKGEQVKSYEECEIANYLFLHGINYNYETSYKYLTATADTTQYQPDFYLVDYDIYLEHFGIDEKGNTAPYIAKDTYLESMVWKRALHRHYNTKMLETYSYERRKGCLLSNLEEKLKKENVQMHLMSFADALIELKNNSQINNFSKTISTFIAHFKSNNHTIDTIRSRTNGDEKLNAFIDIIEPIINTYETTKQSQQVIDFEDMIIRATEFIESGLYQSSYRCILVDEFQDISIARARLVRALHQQIEESVLTVVGDDWQSIYRFAGSDISLFHNFKEYFGESKTVKLDYAFRYNDKISKVSQKFIEANPHQIKKKIKTLANVDNPTVNVWWGDSKDLTRMKTILNNLVAQNGNEAFSVFIIGRTRYSFPSGISSLKTLFPQLDIQTVTAHSSKGLEADYVILSGIEAGPYGFPSTMEGDPLLDIVLAEQENFDFSEERRLFYVVITRARKEVHVLASNTDVSPFMRELEDGYEVNHHYPDNVKPLQCPECKGTLVQRSSQNGSNFLGCSNYSIGCKYTTPIHYCPKCYQGILQLYNDREYQCNNDKCDHTEQACPKCGGRMLKRYGKYNRPFMGCSNFSKNRCNYTINL